MGSSPARMPNQNRIGSGPATNGMTGWTHFSNRGIPGTSARAASLCREGSLLRFAVPTNGSQTDVAVPNAGFAMTPGGPGTEEPPPTLDQHREEILQWLDQA